jgi:hypothetical protein
MSEGGASAMGEGRLPRGAVDQIRASNDAWHLALLAGRFAEARPADRLEQPAIEPQALLNRAHDEVDVADLRDWGFHCLAGADTPVPTVWLNGSPRFLEPGHAYVLDWAPNGAGLAP